MQNFMEIGIDGNPLTFVADMHKHYFYAPNTPEWCEMSEQSAWDDLSWPASTMTFATFYQDVKLVQKQLEEATRTRTGNHAFEIDTNKFEAIKRAITRGTKGYKGLYTILKETADNMSGSIITDDEQFNEFVQKVNDQEKTLREHGDRRGPPGGSKTTKATPSLRP